MSITDDQFTKLVTVVSAILKDKATKDARAAKNNLIQGYSLDEQNIFKEISHPKSPFMLPGQEASQAERALLARNISNDLWDIYTTKIKVGKVFTVGQEALFVQSPFPSVLFDASKKLVLIKGKPGSVHFKVLQEANTKVTKHLNSRPASDATRTFFNENPEYAKLYAELNEELKAEWFTRPEAATATSRQKNKWLENRRKDRPVWKKFKGGFTQNTGGAAAGHVFGGPVQLAAGLFENENDIFERDLGDIQISSSFPSELQPTIRQLVIDVITADAKIEYKRTLGKNSVIGLIAITVPELDVKNASEGEVVGKKFGKLKRYLIENRVKIYAMQGSPSYKQLIAELVENTFLGKKTSPRTFTTTKRIRTKKQSMPIKINKIKGSRVTTRPTVKKKKDNRGGVRNLETLIAKINSRLHDQIQINMGKGQSKKVLNYRTGRFARSARVQHLISTRETNAIVAQVKYMKDPYKIFEVDGKLHKTGRDPALIFGRSIRQILQEAKIANLRRVKVELRG